MGRRRPAARCVAQPGRGPRAGVCPAPSGTGVVPAPQPQLTAGSGWIWLALRGLACSRLAWSGLAGSGLVGTGRLPDPVAQALRLVFGYRDEAQAGPCHAWRALVVFPQQVRAELILGIDAARIDQPEAELVQRVFGQRRSGDQQHARFGEVGDPAHHRFGHGIDHQNRFRDLSTATAAEFAAHTRACSVRGPPPRRARPRSVPSVACHARSTSRARSTVTTRACPRASIRAKLSSDCSPTRWPRRFTNSAWPVTLLYQDRRLRTTSPCWLLTNSIQVPNGSSLTRSYCACSSDVRGASFCLSCVPARSPRRVRVLSAAASSVREAPSSSSRKLARRRLIAAASSPWYPTRDNAASTWVASSGSGTAPWSQQAVTIRWVVSSICRHSSESSP